MNEQPAVKHSPDWDPDAVHRFSVTRDWEWECMCGARSRELYESEGSARGALLAHLHPDVSWQLDTRTESTVVERAPRLLIALYVLIGAGCIFLLVLLVIAPLLLP